MTDQLYQLYEDKAEIWGKMRGKPPIKYEGAELQIFTDLAPETLSRRRLLKPLLEQMRAQNIKYNWEIPACLIGQKDGRSRRLRFPEELQEFCNQLDLQVEAIPGWTEGVAKQ